MSQEESEALGGSGVRLFRGRADERATPLGDVVNTLSGHVYISVDLDIFDPSFMAAVGTPEPGGLGWYEVLRLLRQVAETRKIVGFDVVELAPREGPVACTYIAAKLVYKLIGYSIVLGSAAG